MPFIYIILQHDDDIKFCRLELDIRLVQSIVIQSVILAIQWMASLFTSTSIALERRVSEIVNLTRERDQSRVYILLKDTNPS